MASFDMDIAHEFQRLLQPAAVQDLLRQLEQVDDFLADTDAMFRDLVRLSYIAAANTDDITPHAGVAGAPDDPAFTVAVAEALKTVDAPSDGHDCPICCMDDNHVDDDAATASAGAWRETPCGHRFHGWCVERWLRDKGSCPMCRRQVVTMLAAAAASSSTAVFSDLELVEFGVEDAIMEFMREGACYDTPL